jgi:hypothetical protein
MPTLDRIRRLLRQDWDPLGIVDEPQAEDEYDGYALQIFRMVREGRAAAEIAGYLDKVWADLSGASPTPEAALRNKVIAGCIMGEAAE